MTGKKLLLLAMILGLGTSYLAWSYVESATKAARVVFGPVVVAAVDVPARALVEPSMVKIVQLPLEAKHPDAAVSPELIVGKVARQPITAGEQLLASKLFQQREESGLAYMIPPGKRAVSVALTEVIGSGGMIVPGDAVDVIAVFENRNSADSASDTATTVLQDVLVLAVAQQIEGVNAPANVAQQAGSAMGFGGSKTARGGGVEPPAQPTARSVTLAISPDQAQRLVLAEERGKIRLALRPANDRSIATLPQVSLSGVQEGTSAVTPMPSLVPGQSTSALPTGGVTSQVNAMPTLRSVQNASQPATQDAAAGPRQVTP